MNSAAGTPFPAFGLRDADGVRASEVEHALQGPDREGPQIAPGNHYDDPACVFGTLYAGETLEITFVKTMLRNPKLRLVSLAEVAARRWTARHRQVAGS
ncbi:hypothetical protein [Azospirillum canadense]|uniref:hypothetical protein n=1 Tax=Azospirillum canadense TaxID=403962 RepID=UPI0022261159|nr:hypothetical protein [Azospirillum canadense]